MLETVGAVFMFSKLLPPVSYAALTFIGCKMLFSSLSERICELVKPMDFLERLFSFGSLHFRSLGLWIVSTDDGDGGDDDDGDMGILTIVCWFDFFAHFTQMKISGIFLRLIFAHDKCNHVKHREHSIIGRAAYGFPQ